MDVIWSINLTLAPDFHSGDHWSGKVLISKMCVCVCVFALW